MKKSSGGKKKSLPKTKTKKRGGRGKKDADDSDEIPDYLRESPRWKWIQEANKDLQKVSLKFLKYRAFLEK